jgi:hypothetical protein
MVGVRCPYCGYGGEHRLLKTWRYGAWEVHYHEYPRYGGRLLMLRPIDGPGIEISHEGISVKKVVKIIKKWGPDEYVEGLSCRLL